ncbi:MAG TPA: hypothetical protein VEW95_03310 [Candidatus Limnocylindrales bacterium]|nr:hypothetical protein [Candidatus Limnocylindrales bacterium]
MSERHRLTVAVLILLGILAAVLLVAVAGRACPVDTAAQPCPDVARNRALVVALASVSAALLVAPFAFLAEVMARRRIVYRGAWWRAARRGILTGLTIAAVAGLRLGGVLSVPIAIFVIILAGVIEWFYARRDD